MIGVVTESLLPTGNRFSITLSLLFGVVSKPTLLLFSQTLFGWLAPVKIFNFRRITGLVNLCGYSAD